jgi:hypothetical protein
MQDGISQATKGLAKGSFFFGLALIGFGMLVFVLRDIFAIIAAGIFFLAGFSAICYACKLFWAVRKFNRSPGSSENAYRENVQIHNHQ